MIITTWGGSKGDVLLMTMPKILGCAWDFFVSLLTFCGVLELLMGCLWCIWIWGYGLLHAIFVFGGLWSTKTKYKDRFQ
jgi:uncharacterized membrane protein YecN with MAPEG domain